MERVLNIEGQEEIEEKNIPVKEEKAPPPLGVAVKEAVGAETSTIGG